MRGSPARFLAIAAIRAYRGFVSPLLGEHCRFYPTCSRYALEVFERHGFFKGLILTAGRLARCGPWNPGGVDLPPAEFHFSKMFRRR